MREYSVDVAGLDHTFLYDEDDAKRLGLTPKAEPKAKLAKAPANKARTAKNKSA